MAKLLKWIAILCTTTSALPNRASPDDLLHNDNHIFNAVHSAMRQWGSSIHHNGMSFFVATVPAGTQLYHGRYSDEEVTGREWVAFEPEHALFFVSVPKRRPGYTTFEPHPFDRQFPLRPADDDTEHESDRSASDDRYDLGFLDTFHAKHDLKLLYIDGMSAAKVEKGTLDTQDRVLLQWTSFHGPEAELRRARMMCELLQQEWGTQFDGILRMETGFEIIMCSFAHSLELAYSIKPVRLEADQWPNSEIQHFTYMRNVLSRGHGIGGGRVTLDFDHMVSAYPFIEVPLHNEEHRLVNASKTTLAHVRDQVKRMVHSHEPNAARTTDWQAIADMVVARYSDWLRYLVSAEVAANEHHFKEELLAMLHPFVDRYKVDVATEVSRCSHQFLHRPHGGKNLDQPPSLAQHAVMSISQRICQTLVQAYRDETTLEEKVTMVRDLIEYLQWTTFKECRGCAIDQVCLVATFPFGNEEDHTHPSCQNASRASGMDRNYWWKPLLNTTTRERPSP